MHTLGVSHVTASTDGKPNREGSQNRRLLAKLTHDHETSIANAHSYHHHRYHHHTRTTTTAISTLCNCNCARATRPHHLAVPTNLAHHHRRLAFPATAFRPDSTLHNQPKQPWQFYAMAMLSDNQHSSSSNCRRSSSASSGRRSATNTTASAYVVNAATMDLTAYQYSTCGAGGMCTLCRTTISPRAHTNMIAGVGWCV